MKRCLRCITLSVSVIIIGCSENEPLLKAKHPDFDDPKIEYEQLDITFMDWNQYQAPLFDGLYMKESLYFKNSHSLNNLPVCCIFAKNTVWNYRDTTYAIIDSDNNNISFNPSPNTENGYMALYHTGEENSGIHFGADFYNTDNLTFMYYLTIAEYGSYEFSMKLYQPSSGKYYITPKHNLIVSDYDDKLLYFHITKSNH